MVEDLKQGGEYEKWGRVLGADKEKRRRTIGKSKNHSTCKTGTTAAGPKRFCAGQKSLWGRAGKKCRKNREGVPKELISTDGEDLLQFAPAELMGKN